MPPGNKPRQEAQGRRPRLRALVAAGLLAVAAGGAPAQPSTPPPVLDIQGHRGARGLLPENSLPGFAHALGLGVTTLETDVAITRDKVPVLSHDRRLNPDITRGPDGQFLAGPGPSIASLDLAALQRHDVGRIKPGTAYARTFAAQQPVDGTRIPRLADVFALARRAGNDDVRFALETKITPHEPLETVPPEEFARLLLDAVRDAGMLDRVAIQSFDWRTLQVVQREAPGVPTVYLTMQRPNGMDTLRAGPGGASPWTAGFRLEDHGSVPRMVKAAGGHTWSAYWQDLNAANVREARSLGLKVLAWTVNEPAAMNRLLDMGVDGIITDRPDLLRAEAARRGYALPKPTPVAP